MKLIKPMPPIDAQPVMGLTLVVYGPPQPKQRARKGRFGWFTPKETVAYEKAIANTATMELLRAKLMQRWPRDGYYRVTVRAWFEDARRKDWDNVFKAVTDACNEILWHDDSQVIDPLGSRRVDRENPRTEIRVEVIA